MNIQLTMFSIRILSLAMNHNVFHDFFSLPFFYLACVDVTFREVINGRSMTVMMVGGVLRSFANRRVYDYKG